MFNVNELILILSNNSIPLENRTSLLQLCLELAKQLAEIDLVDDKEMRCLLLDKATSDLDSFTKQLTQDITT